MFYCSSVYSFCKTCLIPVELIFCSCFQLQSLDFFSGRSCLKFLVPIMESYQLLSPTKKPSDTAAVAAAEKPRLEESSTKSPGNPVAGDLNPVGFVGFLEVFVHQARDIHNICIYHKQDVYAKLHLTDDPDVAVSTRIINGGGRNPVFNETLRLNVRKVESSSSLRCEIWMLSRVKNYLEDQLLGFALVPLSDVLVANGKLAQEFSLSSTDLFNSPSGFVQLSVSYFGASPDVMAVSSAVNSAAVEDAAIGDAEKEGCISCVFEKIEFPDLKVVNENHQMVSEYFAIQCDNMDTQQSSESLMTSESADCAPDEAAGVRIVECFSAVAIRDSGGALKDTPTTSSVSTAECPGVLLATSQSASEPLSATSSTAKETHSEVADGEADSKNAVVKPIISINIEPEQPVVQQDIVDMYMKSMQQFTESLANMKLPMDIESTSPSPSAENGDAGSDKKLTTPKGNGSRVFYGSRAFF